MTTIKQTIKRASDAVERALFGATVEESAQQRVALLTKLIDARQDAMLARLAAGLEEDARREEEDA
jgi:hypothetical protein